MRMLRGSLYWGLCPQTPGIYRFFLARMDSIGFHSGDRECLSPAFPAAEPVARVASLRCPIPSDSGRLIINGVVRADYEKPADGDNPLNFVSHLWGSPHSASPHPAGSPLLSGTLFFNLVPRVDFVDFGNYSLFQPGQTPAADSDMLFRAVGTPAPSLAGQIDAAPFQLGRATATLTYELEILGPPVPFRS